jgi:hypothetical protein
MIVPSGAEVCSYGPCRCEDAESTVEEWRLSAASSVPIFQTGFSPRKRRGIRENIPQDKHEREGREFIRAANHAK